MKYFRLNTRSNVGMFDCAKGVMMILIILQHSVTPFYHVWEHQITENIFLLLLGLIGKFTIYGFIPMFFMICGYGFRKTSMNRCMKQQAGYFIKPYFFVALVIIIFTVIKKILLHGSITEGLLYQGLPYLLFFCPGDRAFLGIYMDSIGPIWFFVVFFLGIILLNVVLQNSEIWIQIMYITLFAIIGNHFRSVTMPFCIQQTLICVGYMYLGWLIKKKKFLQVSIPSYLLILIPVLIGLTMNGFIDISQNEWGRGMEDILISYLCGIVLLFAAVSLNSFEGKFAMALCWMGRNALYICCIHTIVYTVIPWEKLGSAWSYGMVSGIFLVIVCHFIAAFGGCYLYNMFKRRNLKYV